MALDNYRYSGYRIVEFAQQSKNSLQEVAERLIPHKQEILEGWMMRQYNAWEPPGQSRSDVQQVFGGLLNNILECMHSRRLEFCITSLEEAGTNLAASQFPFEALIVSVHFLEESYMPFLLNPPSG